MSPSTNDPVVISGMSGRLPECNNIEEFKQKLLDGVDMVTDDDRRWPAGSYGLPKRSGKLKDLKFFDATFFGVHAKQAHVMDPQLRLLLEVTHEAIIDAGINPIELRGSKTGVYVGTSLSESLQFWTNNAELSKSYAISGCIRSMFANRISYTFDFTGPSYSIDSACSSSMLGFEQAVDAINSGKCDSAIVAGTNLLLNPSISNQFKTLNMLSADGKCKAFDASGDGYVRSESVVSVLLQKTSSAKRVYATILGAKCNTDGHKKYGITYPSKEMQTKLIREIYAESGIDPAEVVYVEAHGTGTKAGDVQELNSIVDSFCTSNRKSPLLIGSLKSNMGHSEPAAGLCSLIKLVIAMELGIIPGNLHFENPNIHVPGLHDGRLKVVSQNEIFKGGIIGVNSFGFGGANVHVILTANPKQKPQYTKQSIPRLITVSGRTPEAVNYFLGKIKEQTYDEEFYALIDQIHKQNVTGHKYRGFCLVGEEGNNEVRQVTSEKPQIWFIFTGMGCQWPGMGKDMLRFEHFKRSIERCTSTLQPYGIDLIDIISDNNGTNLSDLRNTFLAVTAIQIALIDILKKLNIEPDGFIGYSIGEIACAYADGNITSEQAILLAYARGTSLLESKLPRGAMASIGLTLEEFSKRAPADIFMACHNSEDNMTISGPPTSMEQFINELSEEGIFTRSVNVFNLAFHSKYIAQAAPQMKKAIDEIITNPKPRSSKWISSSIKKSDLDKPWIQLNSAEYHVNNLISPVNFYEATRHIPENSIVLEIGPHALLQAILKRSLPNNVTNIGMLKRQHPDNVTYFLSNIGRIYTRGREPNISAIYPQVSFPVSRGTPMASNMLKWDHSMEWMVANFCNNNKRTGKLIVEIDLSDDEFKYLTGHVIDGRIIFPASGYMVIVWKTFAKFRNEDFEKISVVLENIKISKDIVLPKQGAVEFHINIFDGSGDFEICESGEIVASGRIYKPEDVDKEFTKLSWTNTEQIDTLELNAEDIYKELHLRGYTYNGSFRGINNSDFLHTIGNLKWEKNWVSFINNMLQFSVLGTYSRDLCMPIGIQRLIIKPEANIVLDSDLIPVYRNNKNDITDSGGIQLRGLTFLWTSKCQNSQPPSKLETYQFIPLIYNIFKGSNVEELLNNTLAVVTQLVFENSGGDLKLKVVEVITEANPHAYIFPKLKQIIEEEPILYVDGIMISSTPVDITAEEGTSIQVIQRDISDAPFGINFHLVVLTYTLLNKESAIVRNAIFSLKSGGFILFREPNRVKNNQLIENLDLIIVYQQVTENETFILTRKAAPIPADPVIITITEKHYDWVEPLREAMLTNEASDCKIYLICQGEELNGLVGLVHCIRQEPGGLNIRSVFIQDNNAEPFSLSSKFYKNELHKDLVLNVLKRGIWGTYRHLLLGQAFKHSKVLVENAFMNTLVRGDLSDFQWVESPAKIHAKGGNSELCIVYFAALNSKDVMLATGKPPAEPHQVRHSRGTGIFGMEFSGTDSNGRRVMGFMENGSLATTVLAAHNFLWQVPEKWSLEQAATIPIAYGISYYALIMRGKLQSRETILINSGSGGIGQSSISIALHKGCKVFTTVGSKTERDFIKKIFPQITDDCIGSSQDTSFEQMIQNQTNGRGVDLVLNTLTREKLRASMRCLAYGGRFLEIGEDNLSNDTPLGLSVFLKNTSFHGIVLDSVFHLNSNDQIALKQLLDDGIQNGAINPLPTKIFGQDQIKEAFTCISSGKYIGKVLLKIRDEERRTEIPASKIMYAVPRTYMNPDKVYILIGGLGGFGLELIRWLISRGATKFVISSRSGIKSGYQSLCMRRWHNCNIKLHISTLDVTTIDGARTLLNEANAFGTVGGIFNLAVVIKDALMQNQTSEIFKVVCTPKVDITKHLDTASRILTPHLDYFVTFSSNSCGRGNVGQSNYGYANSVMERVCEKRHADGLPALAIQWGAIGDVGFVAETMDRVAEIRGTLLQNITSCLSALETFLQQPNPVVSSIVLANKKYGERHDVNEMKLVDIVANILGLNTISGISGDITLADLGVDSLMNSEIKQIIKRNYNLTLNPNEIRALTFDNLVKLENEICADQISSKNKAIKPRCSRK